MQKNKTEKSKRKRTENKAFSFRKITNNKIIKQNMYILIILSEKIKFK